MISNRYAYQTVFFDPTFFSRHIYDWNIVNCDVKQPIQLNDSYAASSRAPGLTSGLQGSVNVHRGALLMVPQWAHY